MAMSKIWDSLADSSIESNESLPLLHSTPQEHCRKNRILSQATKWGYMKQTLSYILRFLFWTAGYNRHVKLISKCYSMFLLSICWYQVVYEIFRLSGRIDFVKDHDNQTVYTTTQQLEYASYLTSAIGTACSYTFMLLCLSVMYTERSNAISPYVALRDMGNSKVRIVLFAWIASTLIFIFYVMLYVYISLTDNNINAKGFRLFIRYFSISSEFLTEWMAMVSMFAFSCSTFAIGTFASDTFRRIKSYTGDSIDDIITIHKELRAIVTETTNAFSGWFLLHWLLYGITVVIGFVVVALHKLGQHSEVERKIYFGTFFGISVFSFVFPCICAAYITTACAAIPSRINNTISADWREGHLFKERRELQLFVSYCAASPVCFKIGRITFTSTLAWFSFFFGSTGLLFHFF